MIRLALLWMVLAFPASAQDVADLSPREGWIVVATDKPFADLVEAVRGAAKVGGLAVVTQAGPTGAAARRGIVIPGNRVLGLFNNDFAVRTLRLSPHAMIEAPIRAYVTENANGTATLSYKLPSAILETYAADSTDPAALRLIGQELDTAFGAVAQAATQ